MEVDQPPEAQGHQSSVVYLNVTPVHGDKITQTQKTWTHTQLTPVHVIINTAACTCRFSHVFGFVHWLHTQTHTLTGVGVQGRCPETERDAAIPHSAPTQTLPLVSVEPANRNQLDYFYWRTIFSFFLLLFGRRQQFGHTATVRAAALSKYREQYARHPHPRRAAPTGLRTRAGSWWQATTADHWNSGRLPGSGGVVLSSVGAVNDRLSLASGSTRGPQGPSGCQQLHIGPPRAKQSCCSNKDEFKFTFLHMKHEQMNTNKFLSYSWTKTGDEVNTDAHT